MNTAFDQTLEVITNIQEAPTPEEICTRLTNFSRQFGLTSMIAGTMPRPGDSPDTQAEHLLVSAFPGEWMQRYVLKSYFISDPVIRRIHSDITPFEWSDTVAYVRDDNSTAARQIFGEAREFGLRSGFAVPMITLDGHIAAVSLAGERADIPPHAPGMLAMISNFAIARAIELSTRRKRRQTVHLTAREAEVLRWAAEGKSEWEISVILGISEHTADKHLANAARKLSASTRVQAVASAIRIGVIK